MKKNKVLVIGGGVENKGAQAMTFYVCNLLQSISTQLEPVILVCEQEYKRQNGKYNINLHEFKPLSLLKYGEWFFKILCLATKDAARTDSDIKDLLSETVLAIDISGYSLSSNFGIKPSIKYLSCISACKSNGIPMIILPQSFGPFKYKSIYNVIMHILLKHELRYPDIIYVRENQSLEALTDDLKLKNISYHHDIILGCDESSFSRFFKHTESVDISYDNSVCIIPSVRISERIGSDNTIELYVNLIKKIDSLGLKIVFASHSNEDSGIVSILCDKCDDMGINAQTYTNDLNSYNACEFFGNFKFIVTSRYHSVVHAYKIAVPCVVVGWANKYYELMSLYNQDSYLVNLGTDINERIVETIDIMSKNHEKESLVIRDMIKRENNSDIENRIKTLLSQHNSQ